MCDGRSRLTDHQAHALADQICDHLAGRDRSVPMDMTEFGHEVAGLVEALATKPGLADTLRLPITHEVVGDGEVREIAG